MNPHKSSLPVPPRTPGAIPPSYTSAIIPDKHTEALLAEVRSIATQVHTQDNQIGNLQEGINTIYSDIKQLMKHATINETNWLACYQLLQKLALQSGAKPEDAGLVIKENLNEPLQYASSMIDNNRSNKDMTGESPPISPTKKKFE